MIAFGCKERALHERYINPETMFNASPCSWGWRGCRLDDVSWLTDFLMKEGADYAEVRFNKIVDFGLVLKNGVLEPPEYAEGYGVGIRVLCGGAMAFASTNIMEKRRLKETGLKALRAAKSAQGIADKVGLSKERVYRDSWKAEYKILPTDVDTKEVLELLRSADAALNDVKGASFPNRLMIFGGNLEEKTYSNSDGALLSSVVPRIGGYFILTAYEGGRGTLQRTVQMSESGGWERVKSMDPAKEVGEEAKVMSKVLLEGRPVTPGKYGVVVGGEVSGIMAHEACGHPQEADRILGREAAQAGESYLKSGDVGLKIGSESLSISDMPSLPNSNGFYLYDDEGVKAEKKVLIKNGVIAGFLHNRETGFELGVQSNASARATSYGREPIIRMSNTFVEPGDFSFEELLEGLGSGLYIKSFQEWNIDDTRWNNRYVGLEAYIVEGGEIKAPVRSPVIEATTGVLFSSVESVGKDLTFNAATCGKGQPEQGAPVWTGGPSMKLASLYIKGR
jgi:TldD protein